MRVVQCGFTFVAMCTRWLTLFVQGVPVPDVEPWFGRSIIRSCSNMDYGTAQRIIDGTITPDMVASVDIREFFRGSRWFLMC
jgi:hypothetical protein